MTDKLKNFIFKKLNDDLSHVELISHGDSIWFVDRENKYWYLELQESGRLFWRWQFFSSFFTLFGMEKNEFEPLIAEWVKSSLNREVKISNFLWLELVLNGETIKPMVDDTGMYRKIDLILGNKVSQHRVNDNYYNTMRGMVML
jgi:hypothetical protein